MHVITIYYDKPRQLIIKMGDFCAIVSVNEENTMKKITLILPALMLLVFANTSYAGTSEVKWSDPDKYTDIRAGNEHRGHFKSRIFKAFEEHFAKLSEKLPEDQLLKIDVSNVDLAGDVRFDSIDRIRVIKSLYIPRLVFTYEVINSDKSIEQSGSVNLKDMGFMIGAPLKYKHKPIPHEKRMLDKWFKKTFLEK